jgi:hypothetical protein
MRTLPAYVRQVGLWSSVADTVAIGDEHIARVRELVEGTFDRAAAGGAS